MSELTLARQILRNQYRILEVLSELLHAPGVTAHRGGRNLHKELKAAQDETLEVLREEGGL